MDHNQRLKLQEMIQQSECENHTSEIRELKHSSKIRENVKIIQQTKSKMKTNDFKTLDHALQSKCFFLFQNYTMIYNKLLKDNLDVKILYRFLDVLECIENGTQDQHEASYEIGVLLKKIYIDKKLEDSPTSNFREIHKDLTFLDYMKEKNK